MFSEDSITVKPSLEKAKKDLDNARSKLKDMRTPHSRSAAYLDAWVKRNFATEGGKVGGWKKLAEGGRWTRRGSVWAFDSSAKILRDTGRLMHSFIPFWSRRNAGIGSKLPYARPHDKGIGVPMRRILPKRVEVQEDINTIMAQFAEQSMKELGANLKEAKRRLTGIF